MTIEEQDDYDWQGFGGFEYLPFKLKGWRSPVGVIV